MFERDDRPSRRDAAQRDEVAAIAGDQRDRELMRKIREEMEALAPTELTLDPPLPHAAPDLRGRGS